MMKILYLFVILIIILCSSSDISLAKGNINQSKLKYLSEKEKEYIEKWETHIKYGLLSAKSDVVKSIQKHRIKESYYLLQQMLEKETDETLLEQLIIACEILNYKEAAPGIYKLMNTGGEKLKITVIKALSHLKYEPAASELISNLSSSNNKIRYYSVFGLGEMSCEKAVEPLIDLYPHEAGDIAKEILNSLGKIGKQKSIDFLISVIDNPAESKLLKAIAVSNLGLLQPEKYFEKFKALYYNSGDDRVKVSLIKVVGEIETEEAEKLLLEALKEENEVLRRMAVRNIEKKYYTKYLDHIKYMSQHDPDSFVRTIAIRCIMKNNTDETNKYILERIFEKGDYFFKLTVINNINLLKKEYAFQLLSRTYQRELTEKGKEKILAAYGKLKNEYLAEYYLSSLKGKSKTRDEDLLKAKILEKLRGKSGKDVKKVYVRAINDESVYVRCKALFYSAYYPDDVLDSAISNRLDKEKDLSAIIEIVRLLRKKKIKGLEKKLKLLYIKYKHNKIFLREIETTLYKYGYTKSEIEKITKK